MCLLEHWSCTTYTTTLYKAGIYNITQGDYIPYIAIHYYTIQGDYIPDNQTTTNNTTQGDYIPYNYTTTLNKANKASKDT